MYGIITRNEGSWRDLAICGVGVGVPIPKAAKSSVPVLPSLQAHIGLTGTRLLVYERQDITYRYSHTGD